jgi:[acyl-carrier-protein] S-malonyltransferase
MLPKLAGLHPRNGEVLAEACGILDRDLFAHYRADNEDAYTTNRDVQLGVFLANHMFLQILEDSGVQADLSCGLSLGEWNHLVHIGALSFQDALRTVELRGLAYDRGPRGAMASIFPLHVEELQEVVDRAKRTGLVEVVNLNSPRQNVVAGELSAVDETMRILDEEFFCDAVLIDRQLPMHSSLFEPVGREFRRVLETLDFQKPRIPYLPNRTGEIHHDPDVDTFVELLSTHVYRPTLWRKSIDTIVDSHPDATFVEVGPKAVLHNMLDSKWHQKPKLHTDSADVTEDHLRRVIASLRFKSRAN